MKPLLCSLRGWREGNIQENALADFTVPSVSGPLALKCECVEASAYLSHYLASYSSTFFRRGKIWGTRSMLQRKLHNSWWGLKVLHNINPSSVYKNDQQKWNLIKIDHLLPVAISRLSSVLCNYLLATCLIGCWPWPLFCLYPAPTGHWPLYKLNNCPN